MKAPPGPARAAAAARRERGGPPGGKGTRGAPFLPTESRGIRPPRGRAWLPPLPRRREPPGGSRPWSHRGRRPAPRSTVGSARRDHGAPGEESGRPPGDQSIRTVRLAPGKPVGKGRGEERARRLSCSSDQPGGGPSAGPSRRRMRLISVSTAPRQEAEPPMPVRITSSLRRKSGSRSIPEPSRSWRMAAHAAASARSPCCAPRSASTPRRGGSPRPATARPCGSPRVSSTSPSITRISRAWAQAAAGGRIHPGQARRRFCSPQRAFQHEPDRSVRRISGSGRFREALRFGPEADAQPRAPAGPRPPPLFRGGGAHPLGDQPVQARGGMESREPRPARNPQRSRCPGR